MFGLSTTSAAVTVTIDNLPLAARVTVPGSGGNLTSGSLLDAVATGTSPVTSVAFELTGHGISAHVVGTATLTLYGWIALFNSAGVPTGTYTLTSVATDATETVTSPGVTVTVGAPASS